MKLSRRSFLAAVSALCGAAAVGAPLVASQLVVTEVGPTTITLPVCTLHYQKWSITAKGATILVRGGEVRHYRKERDEACMVEINRLAPRPPGFIRIAQSHTVEIFGDRLTFEVTDESRPNI